MSGLGDILAWLAFGTLIAVIVMQTVTLNPTGLCQHEYGPEWSAQNPTGHDASEITCINRENGMTKQFEWPTNSTTPAGIGVIGYGE